MSEPSFQGFRLSSSQYRLWGLHGGQGTCPYSATVTLGLESDVDEKELTAALNRLISRFEILRTVFPVPEHMTMPVQAILGSLVVELEPRSADLSKCLVEDERSEVAGLDEMPVRWTNGPLLSAKMVSADSRARWLQLQMPAMCADLRSLVRLAAELEREYSLGTQAGGASEEELQFADLAQWQFDLLGEADDADQEALAAGEAFWQKADLTTLAQTRRFLDLAPRGAFKPSRCETRLAAGLDRAVRTLARRYEVSLSSCFLAAWTALIGRLSGRSDGVIGLYADGRGLEELAGAIGPLSKVVPATLRVTSDERFADVLTACDGLQAELFEWQDYWRPDAIEATPPGYFPIGFEFIRLDETFQDHARLFTLCDVHALIDRHDLRLAVQDHGEEISVGIDYDGGQLSAPWATRLLDQYLCLLRAAAENPHHSVSALELLPPGQREQLLVEFNRPPVCTLEPAVHVQIEELAQAMPDAEAVRFQGHVLTYGGLEERANRLARYLVAQGSTVNTRIGIHLERSLDLAVAVLAVFKSGAAYVPLDPEYPSHRIDLMLNDSQASMLITTEKLAQRINYGGITVSLDAAAAEIGAQDSEPLPHQSDADSLAYIIYTSGSTGQPKGVAISHRSLAASTAARKRYYGPATGRFLLLSSYSFDSSMVGLFWPLCSGGTLVLPEPDSQYDARNIAQALEANSISYTLCVPSLYAYVLSESEPFDLSALEIVIVAGEACSYPLVARHRQQLPPTRLCNEYGPTEGTVWCSVFECADARAGESVPIGRPIDVAALYVLDESLNLVPIGVPGELYLGGAGVADGYFGDPELSRQRFIENPFGVGRLYRTGDMARFRADGQLDYLGRVDDQVKIRGFRVEMGEVEAALTSLPGITQAAVIARHQLTRSSDSSGPEPDEAQWLVSELSKLPSSEAGRLLEALEQMDEREVVAQLDHPNPWPRFALPADDVG